MMPMKFLRTAVATVALLASTAAFSYDVRSCSSLTADDHKKLSATAVEQFDSVKAQRLLLALAQQTGDDPVWVSGAYVYEYNDFVGIVWLQDQMGCPDWEAYIKSMYLEAKTEAFGRPH